jgi:hypothetical protein
MDWQRDDMTYTEFWAFVDAECMYETIYDDSDGRAIVVIRMLDLWGLANKFKQKEKANETHDHSNIDTGR